MRDGELVQQGDAQSIVLEPSDDYVGDFLKNINRGRVVEVGAIMSPKNGARPKLTLADDTVLEDALVELVQGKGRSAPGS